MTRKETAPTRPHLSPPVCCCLGRCCRLLAPVIGQRHALQLVLCGAPRDDEAPTLVTPPQGASGALGVGTVARAPQPAELCRPGMWNADNSYSTVAPPQGASGALGVGTAAPQPAELCRSRMQTVGHSYSTVAFQQGAARVLGVGIVASQPAELCRRARTVEHRKVIFHWRMRVGGSSSLGGVARVAAFHLTPAGWPSKGATGKSLMLLQGMR